MRQIKYYIGMLLLFLSITGCLKENLNPAEGTPASLAALIVVKDLYHGKDVKITPELLSGASLTTGVVISEPTSQNLPEGYVIIQNVWRNKLRGIALVLEPTLAQKFQVGDSLVLHLEGGLLREEKGHLTLQGLQEQDIQVVSSNHEVIIQSVSLGNLSENFDVFESTMVATTADLNPYPSAGETLAGEKEIDDGGEGDKDVLLFTSPNAVFSSERVSPSATFQGIAFTEQGKKQLRMRTLADMKYPSGSIYAGFPEGFDEPDATVKNNYNKPEIDNNVDLLTGNWHLFQAILGVTANRDRIVSGKQAIRFQQNLKVPALLQMNFDVADGASKVTFWYGAYYTDASSTFILEASQDQGETWTQVGEPITDPHKTSESLNAKQATFMMDFKGPVRFRINKLGLGSTSGTSVQNGRLGVDDFAIYKSY